MNFRFERTRDYDLVRRIIAMPDWYGVMTDDFSPPRECFRPYENDAIWHVLAGHDKGFVGLFSFAPQNAICWEVHCILTEEFRGSAAREAATQVFEWIWRNTSCLKIAASIPSWNSAAIRLARDVGMQQFGVNKRSVLKHGRRRDQVLFGIEKPQQKEPAALAA